MAHVVDTIVVVCVCVCVRVVVRNTYADSNLGYLCFRPVSALVSRRVHVCRRYIQATCATTGDGLYEGLDWLSNTLKKKPSS